MGASRDVEFLFEIGCLRFIPRMWKRFLNMDVANLAEHHMRVAWTAMIIAVKEKADVEKVLKMALVHDIGESRTNDVDYLSRQYVVRNEDLGVSDMLKNTSVEKELLKLFREYEALETLEAKIVKDADNLDIDLELQEQLSRGVNMIKHWGENRQYVHSNKLHTKTAKELWKQIRSADPHGWHTKGRNRRLAGDWKS